ncbi:MAG TPA: hypothetical protein VLB29_17295 [Nocardioidaceae bacterium]|nr:hypothetical protein [Nocardioidaceae bacterium]
MKYKVGIALAVAAVAGFSVVGPGQAANDDLRNKYPNGTQSAEDCTLDGDTLTYYGPAKMWPPNHKLQDILFEATSSTGGPVDLAVTPQVTDVAGGDGGPRHDPDVVYSGDAPAASGTGSAELPMQLRSERSGKGDGRTYTLDAVATYDMVRTCSMQVVVAVPHDMRGGADW